MSRLLPRDHVRLLSSEHGAVLLDTSHGQFYGLNPAGAIAWTALASGGDREDAVAAVVAHFDIDDSTVRRDVDDLVALLLTHGLIEAAP